MSWTDDGWLLAARQLPSPNFGPRPIAGQSVSLLVVHNISLPPGEFSGEYVEDFFLNRLSAETHPYFAEIAGLTVSAHFYIRREGELVQFVSCDARAWHAGQSSWQGRDNCNDYSIGVELAGCDDVPYTAAQYQTLWALIAALQMRYPIQSVAGHCHVAPGRKTDPGHCFEWSAVQRQFPDLCLAAEVSGHPT